MSPEQELDKLVPEYIHISRHNNEERKKEIQNARQIYRRVDEEGINKKYYDQVMNLTEKITNLYHGINEHNKDITKVDLNEPKYRWESHISYYPIIFDLRLLPTEYHQIHDNQLYEIKQYCEQQIQNMIQLYILSEIPKKWVQTNLIYSPNQEIYSTKFNEYVKIIDHINIRINNLENKKLSATISDLQAQIDLLKKKNLDDIDE